jgi:molybdopterin-containing oxidoreductase family membrane subunit
LNDALLAKLGRLQIIFVLVTVYFVLVFLATNWYASEHRAIVLFLIRDGDPYAGMFWFGQIIAGCVLPLLLLRFIPADAARSANSVLASVLIIVGGLAQLYIIIIGGQAYPLILFPGKIESSAFFDGSISLYTPSAYEVMLGLGGTALAVATIAVMVRLFPIVPARLDEDSQAHG